MPATLSPARASGSTATPPAAPNPTTATSTGLRLMATMFCSPRRPMIRLGRSVHLLHIRGGCETRSGILDQIPSSEILVAAVVRIAEHAFERQPARASEERLQVVSFSIVDV